MLAAVCKSACKSVLDKKTYSHPPTLTQSFLRYPVNQFPILYYVTVFKEKQQQTPAGSYCVYNYKKNNQSLKCGRHWCVSLHEQCGFFKYKRKKGDILITFTTYPILCQQSTYSKTFQLTISVTL